MDLRIVVRAGLAFALAHFVTAVAFGVALHGYLLSDYYLVHEGFWTPWALDLPERPLAFGGFRLAVSLVLGLLMGFMFRPVRYRFAGGPIWRGLVFSTGVAALQVVTALWISTVIDLPPMIWTAWCTELVLTTWAGGAALGWVAGGAAG